MTEPARIRSISDLRDEMAKVRSAIRQKESELTEDYGRLADSMAPARIIASVTKSLITNLPALYSVFSFIRRLFGKKKSSGKK